MMTDVEQPPVLLALPTPDGSRWRVWCVHCETWHTHGAEPGHRAAHCHVTSSPYRESGYILRLARG